MISGVTELTMPVKVKAIFVAIKMIEKVVTSIPMVTSTVQSSDKGRVIPRIT